MSDMLKHYEGLKYWCVMRHSEYEKTSAKDHHHLWLSLCQSFKCQLVLFAIVDSFNHIWGKIFLCIENKWNISCWNCTFLKTGGFALTDKQYAMPHELSSLQECREDVPWKGGEKSCHLWGGLTSLPAKTWGNPICRWQTVDALVCHSRTCLESEVKILWHVWQSSYLN